MMAKRLLILLVAVVLVCAGALWLWRRGPGPILYVGGPILTMDAEDRVVSGLGVEEGRIAVVGDESELRDWARARGARVVDLEGRALLPGFIDAHGHFPGGGRVRGPWST